MRWPPTILRTSRRCVPICTAEGYPYLTRSQLPGSVLQAYHDAYGVPPSATVLTFLKNELMQQIWLALMEEDFMDAYVNGFLHQCGDGIIRRIFPRFFAYSADYPEKYGNFTHEGPVLM